MIFSVYAAKDAEARRVDSDWGSLCWLAGKGVGNADGLTLGRVTIKAGRSNPPHSHGNCEEALHLLAGRLEHFVGAESVVLEPADTIVIAPGAAHWARGIGEEDADMIVAYSAGQREFTKV